MALVAAASVVTAVIGVAALALNGFCRWIALERERLREMADAAARVARMDAFEERVNMHELALKNALGEIHAKFVEHDAAISKVTSEAATVVAGTVDAMTQVPTWGRS